MGQTNKWAALALEQRWLLGIFLLGATCVAVSTMLGAGALLLVLAGLSLVAAIALFWSSMVGADAPLTVDEAVALIVPSSEEERKMSVLRALKDLEYERVVGKISEQDYALLTARYRAEAKRLLYLVDQEDSERLAMAEAEWRDRLAAEGLRPTARRSDPSRAPESSPSDGVKHEPEKAEDGS